MVSTLLEIAGGVLLVVACGIAFGSAAACAAAGAGCVMFGLAADR